MLLPPSQAQEFLKGYKALITEVFGREPSNMEEWVQGRDETMRRVLHNEVEDLSAQHGAWIERISQATSGDFIFLKRYKNYCAMQHMKSEVFYAVRALTTPLEEMFPEFSIITACLIPFNGMMVCDGLLRSGNVLLGRNMMNQARDDFWVARRSGALVFSQTE